MLKSHSTQLVCKSRTRVALIVIYTMIESSFLKGNPLPTFWGLIQLCLVLRHPLLEHPEAWGHCQRRCTPLRSWRWLNLHGSSCLPVLVNFLASNPCRHESLTTRPSRILVGKKATHERRTPPFQMGEHRSFTQLPLSNLILYSSCTIL